MLKSTETIVNHLGQVISVWLTDYGDIHREDGPAVVCKNKDGTVVSEGWYNHNVVTRAGDGPALVYRNDYGKVIEENWFEDGQVIKTTLWIGEIKRSIVEDDFNTTYLTYDKDDVLHCESGPSIRVVDRFSNRSTKECWHLHGEKHNARGPAVVGENGLKEFWIHGKQLDEAGFLAYLNKGSKGKESTMAQDTKPNSTKVNMKDKVQKAAARVATRKLVKGLQSLLADQMTRNIRSAKTRSAAKEGIVSFLQSEAGKGALGLLLGAALPYAKGLPMLAKYSDKIDYVADEFAVEGLAVAGEFAVDQLAELVEPATILIKSYLESLSSSEESDTKVRIENNETLSVKDVASSDEEEEEFLVELPKAKRRSSTTKS